MKTIIATLSLIVVVIGLLIGWAFFASRNRQEQVTQRIELAQKTLQAGDYQKALDYSNAILDKYHVREQLADVLVVKARALDGLGQKKEALDQWRQLNKDYANSSAAPAILAGLANDLLAEGSADSIDQAYNLYNTIEKKYPKSPEYYDAQFGFAQIAIRDGDAESLKSALASLYLILDNAPDYAHIDDVERVLGNLNLKIFNSDITMDGEEIHEIAPHETLYGLGKKYKMNYNLIMLANHISDAGKLRLGQRIKIPNIDFAIQINKESNALTLTNHGKFFKKYAVHTGTSDTQTPMGEYRILDKKKPPLYFMPFSGEQIGFYAVDAIPSSMPASGAANGPAGVGLARTDLVELYNLLPIGTPVVIAGKQQSLRRHNPGVGAPHVHTSMGLIRSVAAVPAASSPVAQAQAQSSPASAPTQTQVSTGKGADEQAAADDATPTPTPKAKSTKHTTSTKHKKARTND